MLRWRGWDGLKAIFKEYVAGNYHPLTVFSYWIEFGYAGATPEKAWVYHLTNVLFHALNGVLVFIFTMFFVRGLWTGLLGAIFWVIHPMHVESVAWISERKDVLYSFFYLMGLILWCRHCFGIKIHLFLIHLFHLLALLSKPAAIVFPFTCLAVSWYFRRDLREDVKKLIPSILLSLIFSYITIKAQQSSAAIMELKQMPVYYRVFSVSFGVFTYIVKFFFPYDQTPFYPYPDYSYGIPKEMYFYVAFTIILILAVIFLFIKGWLREFVFGFLFFIINLLLVLQVVAIGSAIAAERYTYMPYAGFAIPWLLWCEKLTGKGWFRWILLPSAVVVYFFFLISKAKDMVEIWHDGKSLWKYFIKQYPHIGKGYFHLAGWYAEYENNYDSAFVNYMEAIKRSPAFAESYIYVGNIYGIRHKYDSALYYYRKAEELGSTDPTLFVNKGIVFSITGKVDSALNAFSKAISKKPDNPETYYNRSVLYFNIKEYEKALSDINTAIYLRPDASKNYIHKARILREMGKKAEALHALQLYFRVGGIMAQMDTSAKVLFKELSGR